MNHKPKHSREKDTPNQQDLDFHKTRKLGWDSGSGLEFRNAGGASFRREGGGSL